MYFVEGVHRELDGRALLQRPRLQQRRRRRGAVRRADHDQAAFRARARARRFRPRARHRHHRRRCQASRTRSPCMRGRILLNLVRIAMRTRRPPSRRADDLQVPGAPRADRDVEQRSGRSTTAIAATASARERRDQWSELRDGERSARARSARAETRRARRTAYTQAVRDDLGKPIYVQLLWPTAASSVTIVSGVEARMIEAEAQRKPPAILGCHYATLNAARATVHRPCSAHRSGNRRGSRRSASSASARSGCSPPATASATCGGSFASMVARPTRSSRSVRGTRAATTAPDVNFPVPQAELNNPNLPTRARPASTATHNASRARQNPYTFEAPERLYSSGASFHVQAVRGLV